MIFADKLINLRKKNGFSQEELAEKIGVSRQAVSKWESAQSIPDIDKIITLSELFGVSTDFLLKDEIEMEDSIPEKEEGTKLTVEKTNDYLDKNDKASTLISIGVMLCVFSPVLLILFGGLSEVTTFSEDLAAVLGLVILFAFVAFAVVLFIKGGMLLNEFKFLEQEDLILEYGIKGIVTEKKKKYNNSFYTNIIIGVVLCIISVVPLIASNLFNNEFMEIIGVCLTLLIDGFATKLFVKSGMIMNAYDLILKEGEYANKKKTNAIYNAITSVFWLLTTTIFLLISFTYRNWHISWIIWVVAALIFACFSIIYEAILNKKKNNK